MKAFSIFLLVCFSLVLTPKHWWHHCQHTKHASKTEHKHTQTLDEDCPICDLSLSVYTQPTPHFFRFEQPKPYVQKVFQLSVVSQDKSDFFQLRAPPSNCV